MTPDPTLSNDAHPLRSELQKLEPTSIHVQAYNLAQLIADMPRDPSTNMSPRALCVGSYSVDPENAKDLDLEVQGVSWEYLQDYFKDKQDQHGIKEVVLTIAGRNGVIDRDQGHRGNAFVAVWLTLDNDRRANITIPIKVFPNTNRYDLNSLDHDPKLGFKEAATRRSFAHKAVGYDPLTGDRGEVVDPHLGCRSIQQKELEILDPESFKNDPLSLYVAIKEMANYDMSASSATAQALTAMAMTPLPTSTAAIRPERLAAEKSSLLTAKLIPPSGFLSKCYELGILERDFAPVHKVIDSFEDPQQDSVWTTVLKAVDEAWASASTQDWSDNDKLALVVARLAYELMQVDDVDTEISCQEVAQIFLHGDDANQAEQLEKIEASFNRLS